MKMEDKKLVRYQSQNWSSEDRIRSTSQFIQLGYDYMYSQLGAHFSYKSSKGPLIFCKYKEKNFIGIRQSIKLRMKANCSSLLLALVVLGCLVTLGSSIGTFSRTYDNTATSLLKTCTFPLGTVLKDNTIKVNVTLWNNLATSFSVLIKKASDHSTLATGTCTSVTTCGVLFYTVDVTGQYEVTVSATSVSTAQIYPFYLVGLSYYGNTTYPGNPTEQVLAKTGDVLRYASGGTSYVGRMVYYSRPTTVYMSIQPIESTFSPSQVFYLIPLASDYTFSTGGQVTLTEILTPRVNSKMNVKAVIATKGFYLLAGPAAGAAAEVLTATWQSDPYACPYDPSFVDYYGIAQGCTQSKSQIGLPCLTFDNATQLCKACITGYILDPVAGICSANTTCPDRQYFHFGVCYNVSVLCGNYQIYTGNCQTCADPANYDLVNGSCVHKSVTCGARQWQTNYTCYNVSDKCATFDPATGKCLSCTDPLFQVATDGSCIRIVVECPAGQYAVGLNCVSIPVECLNFDTARGVCLSCARGYYSEAGVCKRVVCPDGQVPSRFGLFCINVSPLCDTYDAVTGDCLSCKQPNHRVNPNGACAQYNSPLAGCSERQRLGFGRCDNADRNCKAYNLISSNCDECEGGYYLDYTGHCVKSPTCGPSQWSVGGECISVPENCLKINNLGLCTRCVSSIYRLELGQCVYFKGCESGQYLNALGECVDVNPACALFNPTNGQCVTCKDSSVQPSLGVCCPAGQIFDRVNCVDAVVLQNANQNATGSGCLLWHPATGNCLSCAQGYTPDLTLGCVAE